MFSRRHFTALFSLPLLFCSLNAFADPLYAWTFLPLDFYAADINSSGQIVGTFQGSAAVWSAPSSTTSLNLPGSEGLAINDHGDVAGRNQSNAFAWIGGTYADIATGTPRSWATGINNAGQVTGTQAGNSAIDSQQAFRYSGGALTVIAPDITYANQGSGFAINNAGVVAGTLGVDFFAGWADPAREAFTYADGVVHLAGTLGGHISEAEDINDSGELAGWSTGPLDTENRAFRYTAADGMVDLGTLGGTISRARGLNNLGLVVGQSEPADGSDFHAFLYVDGAMRDLNALVKPAADWQLVSALDINDAGQILAEACNASTNLCQSVRLDLTTPVPEPSTWVLLLAGVGLCAARCWRRPAAVLAVPLLAMPLAASAGTTEASKHPAFTMRLIPPGFVAHAINNIGEIAGTWQTGTPQQAAAILTEFGVISIFSLAPGSTGLAINDRGQMAGVWNDQAFFYNNGTVRDLGHIGFWGTSEGVALNDNGDVAGVGYQNFAEEYRGWRYSRGILNMIGSFGGDWSVARAINSRGDVAGYAAIPPVHGPFSDSHAFVYRNRVLVDLGAFNDGAVSRANDINNAGQVVGAAEYSSSFENWGLTHPFLHQPGVLPTLRDLGTLGGNSATANGINNAGAVVGESLLADQVTRHAFLYEGALRDLDALVVKPQGWVIVSAQDINDQRQILATACLIDNCTGVRLDPIVAGAR